MLILIIHFCRYNNRNKIKLGHAIKSNILGERFAWFTNSLDKFPEQTCLTSSQFSQLIEEYRKIKNWFLFVRTLN